MSILLRGMTWDDPRGWGPMLPVGDAFARTPAGRETSVEWDIQPVSDFEDRPLADFAGTYDLLVIDHPHVGEAAESGCLVSVEESPPDYIGPSSESYWWNGSWLAYPINAACHVCAYHPGRCRVLPKNWDEVFEQSEHGLRIAIPLGGQYATMALCTLLASSGHPLDPDTGFPPVDALRPAMDLLRRLVDVSKRDSLSRIPLQSLNALAENSVDYIALTFGYVSFESRGVRFGLAPSMDERPSRGALFGGTGLAVSSGSQHPEAALAFARFASSGPVQSTLWPENGGQPAHQEAWDLLSETDPFYRDTAPAMETAYLRPRFDGWIPFQAAAGEAICEWLSEPNRHIKSLDRELRQLWDRAKNGKAG